MQPRAFLRQRALKKSLLAALAAGLAITWPPLVAAADPGSNRPPAPGMQAGATGKARAAAQVPATLRSTAVILRSIQADQFRLPPAAPTGSALKLWATYYYVHEAQSLPDGLRLQDMAGTAISATISPRDLCLGAIEGTLRIRTGKRAVTYNIAGNAASPTLDCAPHVAQKEDWVADLGKARFKLAHGPFGDGIALAHTSAPVALVPFRSIATDARLIAPGSVLYIPAARGLKFRDTLGRHRVHDGYFLAADSGPAIQGEHIDVFTGNAIRNPFGQLILSEPISRFDAFIVETPTVRNILLELHRP